MRSLKIIAMYGPESSKWYWLAEQAWQMFERAMLNGNMRLAKTWKAHYQKFAALTLAAYFAEIGLEAA